MEAIALGCPVISHIGYSTLLDNQFGDALFQRRSPRAAKRNDLNPDDEPPYASVLACTANEGGKRRAKSLARELKGTSRGAAVRGNSRRQRSFSVPSATCPTLGLATLPSTCAARPTRRAVSADAGKIRAPHLDARRSQVAQCVASLHRLDGSAIRASTAHVRLRVIHEFIDVHHRDSISEPSRTLLLRRC